jgi:hypothetical protein
MPVTRSTPYKEGFSKTLFECPLCTRLVRAHELVNYLDNLVVRDARLFCKKCSKRFNGMTPHKQTHFLLDRFAKHYGDRQFIYALNDPRTGSRRYIGRASDPQKRFGQHLRIARNWLSKSALSLSESNLSSKRWVAELIRDCLQPQLEILETVSPPMRVCEREMRWISQGIKEGHDLLNIENSIEKSRTFVQKQELDSFLTVPLGQLIKTRYPQKIERLLGGRDTGWRRAILIHGLHELPGRLEATYP